MRTAHIDSQLFLGRKEYAWCGSGVKTLGAIPGYTPSSTQSTSDRCKEYRNYRR